MLVVKKIHTKDNMYMILTLNDKEVTLKQLLKSDIDIIENKDINFYCIELMSKVQFNQRFDLRGLSLKDKLIWLSNYLTIPKKLKVDDEKYYYFK